MTYCVSRETLNSTHSLTHSLINAIFRLVSNVSATFLDPEGGSQKVTLVVLLLVAISSLKISKAF